MGNIQLSNSTCEKKCWNFNYVLIYNFKITKGMKSPKPAKMRNNRTYVTYRGNYSAQFLNTLLNPDNTTNNDQSLHYAN